MPIYEYMCKNSHKSSDWVQLAEDAPNEIECPHCETPAKRIASTFAMHFTGEARAESDKPFRNMGKLADTDGINPVYHKSENPFIDLGKRK